MTPKEIDNTPIVEPKNWLERMALRQGKIHVHWSSSWWFLSLLFGIYICVIVFFMYPIVLKNVVPAVSETTMSFILDIILFFLIFLWIMSIFSLLTIKTLYKIIQRLVEKEKSTQS